MTWRVSVKQTIGRLRGKTTFFHMASTWRHENMAERDNGRCLHRSLCHVWHMPIPHEWVSMSWKLQPEFSRTFCPTRMCALPFRTLREARSWPEEAGHLFQMAASVSAGSTCWLLADWNERGHFLKATRVTTTDKQNWRFSVY